MDHRRGLLRGGDAAGQPGVGGQQPLDLGPVRVLAGGQQPVGAGDGDIGTVLAQQHGEPGPALGDGQDVGRAPVGTGDVRVSAVAEEQAG